MKILFLGTGTFGVSALEALRGSSHELLGVVTGTDKPQGRSQQVQANPIKSCALKNHIPVFEFSPDLKKLNADVWVVVAFGVLLPKEMLSVPKLCALNIHASLLPRWRGASPIQSSLLNGDKDSGVTIMRLVEKLDAGDVLVQKKIPISGEDYFLDLEKKLREISGDLLIEVLELLEKNKAVFKPQDEKLATLCRKISKKDGHVNWNDSAENIRNRLRAFQKWPGMHSFYEGKRMIWHRMDLANDSRAAGARPGQILEVSGGKIVIAAKDGALSICALQLEGRKILSAEEFLKGFRLEASRILE